MTFATDQAYQTVPSVSPAPPFLQRECDCGESAGASEQCASCTENEKLGLQTKLTVNAPGDAYEQEADRVADQLVSDQNSPDTATSAPVGTAVLQRQEDGLQRQGMEEEEEEMQLQRREGAEEEEEEMQAKGAPVARTPQPGFASRLSSEAQSGRALSPDIRSNFESRLGRDLSAVRIHDTPRSHRLNRDINARAFTHRNHIYFGTGQYDHHSTSGRHLLAHEITHTLQQTGAPEIQRSVHSKSKCTASKHNAPAKPLEKIAELEKRASQLAAGTGLLMGLESISFSDPTLSKSTEFKAYEERFGTAPKKGKRWKSRFRGKRFKVENDAIEHELNAVAKNFQKISKWFSGNVRYVCPGKSRYTIPGCQRGKCTALAEACPGSRWMGLCPGFWTMASDDARSVAMIHEAVHARLRYSPHSIKPPRRRIRNPECYEAVVSDVYGLGLTSFTCPKV